MRHEAERAESLRVTRSKKPGCAWSGGGAFEPCRARATRAPRLDRSLPRAPTSGMRMRSQPSETALRAAGIREQLRDAIGEECSAGARLGLGQRGASARDRRTREHRSECSSAPEAGPTAFMAGLRRRGGMGGWPSRCEFRNNRSLSKQWWIPGSTYGCDGGQPLETGVGSAKKQLLKERKYACEPLWGRNHIGDTSSGPSARRLNLAHHSALARYMSMSCTSMIELRPARARVTARGTCPALPECSARTRARRASPAGTGPGRR